MPRALAGLVLCLAVTALPGGAAAPEAPLVTDPLGDAGPNLVGVPAGFEWGDLSAAWLDEETLEDVKLRVEVARAGEAPLLGEVALHFGANGTYFIVGWTTILFPAPPFQYRGGFICPAQADGSVDPSLCDGVEATVGNNVYSMTVDRARLGVLDAGARITEPRAYADWYSYDGTAIHVDATSLGGEYVFGTGRAAPTPDSGGEEPDPEGEGPGASQGPAGRGQGGDEAGGRAPPVGVALSFVALAGLAWAGRRRRVP